MNRAFFLLFISVCLFSCKTECDWQQIFNEKDLSGLTQVGGNAIFRVENGELVGVTVRDSPNSFLCTKKEYSDFILEFEAKTDNRLNSGVQFRSHKNDKVYGYQLDIDPTERGWTGGIYDESRRGWLYPVTPYNPKAKDAFKKGNWNRYRIEAVGNRIRTWLNDVPIADLLDDADVSGFIAFQVHSVSEDMVGAEVRWRNVRIATRNLDEHATDSEITINQVNCIPNTISDFERRNGWGLLFNGESTEKWLGVNDSIWTAENGALVANGDSSKIVSSDLFANFALSFDFKLTEGSDASVMYIANLHDSLGFKYQLVDDDFFDIDNEKLGSLCNLLPATNKRFNGIGNWNNAKIIVNKNRVEHWLNGFKLLEANNNNLKKMAGKTILNKLTKPSGHIVLESNRSNIYFRSIKIRSL